MGQCSTLPTEATGRQATSSSGIGGVRYHEQQERDDYATGRRSRHHYGYVPQKNHGNATPTAAMTESFENEQYSATTATTTGGQPNSSRGKGGALHVKVPQQQSNNAMSPGHNTTPSRRTTLVHFADDQHPQRQQQQYHPSSPYGGGPGTPPPYPKSHGGKYAQDDVMEEVQDEKPIPSPPDSAVRTRCYKLNLESNLVGLTGGEARVVEGQLLGPFAEAPPALTHTKSDDSDATADATAVAVRTAKIFRGITISDNGTILSQNARATRANRNKKKQGEKSRQAAKIDKAKDLVEESIVTGKAPGSDDPANMVSLVTFGEYDNMNHLVRDGAKKLREATASELSDEDLLAANLLRPSHSSGSSSRMISYGTPTSSTRKRGSPHSVSQPKPSSRYSSNSSKLPQSAPPKLKGHPRDRPSTRRLHNNNNNDNSGGNSGFRRAFPQDACNGMFAVHPHSGGTADSDWSGPLGFSRGLNSFFYCGGADQTVATQPATANHKDNKKSNSNGVGTSAAHAAHHHHMATAPPPQQPEYRSESAYGRSSYNQQQQQQGGSRMMDSNSQRENVPGGRESIGPPVHV